VEGGVAWITAQFPHERVHDCVFPGAGHSVHRQPTADLFERALRELAFRGTPAAFERE
jgi:hypothetical protein